MGVNHNHAIPMLSPQQPHIAHSTFINKTDGFGDRQKWLVVTAMDKVKRIQQHSTVFNINSIRNVYDMETSIHVAVT